MGLRGGERNTLRAIRLRYSLQAYVSEITEHISLSRIVDFLELSGQEEEDIDDCFDEVVPCFPASGPTPAFLRPNDRTVGRRIVDASYVFFRNGCNNRLCAFALIVTYACASRLRPYWRSSLSPVVMADQ